MVSRSSTKVEYKVMANATAELMWIQTLPKKLCISVPKGGRLWCDNMSTMYLSSNPIFQGRTKYIEVDYHFVTDQVMKKQLEVRLRSNCRWIHQTIISTAHGGVQKQSQLEEKL
jgi:EAL domain-containing protein (putative c-di-GMP-specific phosphodiesterase class I)